MTVEENGPKLRTLDDLTAAMAEGGGGKCDRCRREPATLRLDGRLRPLRSQNGTGPAGTAAKLLADGCEQCGVDILAVVARSVGRVR